MPLDYSQPGPHPRAAQWYELFTELNICIVGHVSP